MNLNIKFTTSTIIALVLCVVIVVGIVITLKRCTPTDTGLVEWTKHYTDSVQHVQDSVVASVTAESDSIQKENILLEQKAIAYSDAANEAKHEADKNYTKFLSAQVKYEKLKDGQESEVTRACDTVIAEAQATINTKDSVIKKQDSVIVVQAKRITNLGNQLVLQKKSTTQFKNDFMNLKTNVVAPLQSQLTYSNKQWATNRTWKKIGWGVAAALGTAFLIKK